MDAYQKNLDGTQAAWAAKKYCSHIVIPDRILDELEKSSIYSTTILDNQPCQSFLPTSSGELEMTSNRKLRVGPSQRKSTNSHSRAWAHLYKLPHVVGGPIL